MDKLYTFTAYLFLVTCIATNCTVMSQGTTSSLLGSEKAKIHVNVIILAETSRTKFYFYAAKICSLRRCNEIQYMQLSDTCDMKIICRQTCNMSNACYGAICNGIMSRCLKFSNNGGQTCENLVFKFKDGTQLNRTCIGPGELPCSCTPCQRTIACWKKCLIGCVCYAESKNCSPTTTITTPITNGTTTPDTNTRTPTTRSEPTITTSSGSATTTEVSTTATDTTASDTPAGTTTLVSASGKTSSSTPAGTATSDPASGKTASDGQDGSQMGVLIGGVVGGLFGGVVITVVIVFLCRACRSNRRHAEDEDGAGTKEFHTYLGLIHATSSSGKSPPGTNAVTTQVPDLIKVSAVQQASSASSDVYDVIKEGDDYQLGMDPSVCDQGDYVDITDDMTGAAVYSLAQAAPGMAVQGGTPQPAEYFVLEKDDPTDGDYNRLVKDGATETGTDVQGTYNRLVRGDATGTGTDVQGTYNRLVRDSATATTTDVQGTYNKLGSMADENDDNEQAGNNGTAADYFVLEKPEDTYNKLAQAAPGMAVQDGTPPSAAEYFVLEKDDPTDGDYNKLVREGATETGTDVQDTYNKLGSMADDNGDNEPGGNNGTAADYFVLEKPEDTYNKL